MWSKLSFNWPEAVEAVPTNFVTNQSTKPSNHIARPINPSVDFTCRGIIQHSLWIAISATFSKLRPSFCTQWQRPKCQETTKTLPFPFSNKKQDKCNYIIPCWKKYTYQSACSKKRVMGVKHNHSKALKSFVGTVIIYKYTIYSLAITPACELILLLKQKTN